jgi:hypothetical protein
MIILIIIAIIVSAVVIKFIQPALVWLLYSPNSLRGAESNISLIGEDEISDRESVYMLGKQIIDEAEYIWSVGASDWYTLFQIDDYQLVQSKKVVIGPFNNSGILITRASTIVYNISSRSLFSLMTSKEGFKIIDTLSDPDDFSNTIKHYSFDKPGATDATTTFANLTSVRTRLPWPFSLREFCLLNVINSKSNIFISKSIRYNKSIDGNYSTSKQCYNSSLRAVNTFAIKVESVGSMEARVKFINYLDFNGIPSPIMNWVNGRLFYQIPGGLFDRVQHFVNSKNSA